MIDLRMYKPSGNFEDTRSNTEVMSAVNAEDSTATSIEVIAGKVVKYMLTEKGSDAFDADYGSTSMHYVQLSPDYLPQFKREVLIDVENCQRYIKEKETDYSVDGERLYTIELLDIRYEPWLTPGRVDVYIEIVTTYGKRACVAITSRTDS